MVDALPIIVGASALAFLIYRDITTQYMRKRLGV